MAKRLRELVRPLPWTIALLATLVMMIVVMVREVTGPAFVVALFLTITVSMARILTFHSKPRPPRSAP